MLLNQQKIKNDGILEKLLKSILFLMIIFYELEKQIKIKKLNYIKYHMKQKNFHYLINIILKRDVYEQDEYMMN